MMSIQNAIIVSEIGKPLVRTTRLIPTPGGYQLLIKVSAAGINPHDQKIRDLGLFQAVPPCILSTEIVGTVTALGPDVKNFKIGDRVFAQSRFTPDTAGLQEYALLDSRVTAIVPPTLSDDEAATFPVNFVASFVALFHESGFGLPPPFPDNDQAKTFDYAAQSIVIIGGGSNCGKAAVQLASLAGLGQIIAIAAPRSIAELKGYGATHVVNRHLDEDQIRSQIQSISGDVIFVLDTINKDHALAVSLLSPIKRGRVATLIPGTVDDAKIGEKEAGYRIGMTFGDSHLHRETVGAGFWKALPGWIESGKVKPLEFRVVDGGLNVEGVNKVLDDYRDGKYPGKWHVHPRA